MQKTQTNWGKNACLESVQPNPCSRHRQLQQVAQSSVQLGFQFLRVWGLYKLTSQSVPEFAQPHHKKAFFPPILHFIAQDTDLPVADVCCPLYGRVVQHRCHKEVPTGAKRCVAAAPASCPVGKRALGGNRQRCLPLSPCLWGSRSFQYPKGKAAQSGNTAWQFC